MRFSESARRWAILGGTWLLGIIFMAAAFLKALELDVFRQQIARYQLLPANLELPAAIGLIALEGIIGVVCLLGFRLRPALWMIIGLLALFLIATLFRWNLLQDSNCGCFGSLLVGGPRALLLHTTLFIALAATLLVLLKNTFVTSPARGGRVAAGVFAMFLLLFVAQPFSGNSTLSQNVFSPDQTRIFLSATCDKCKKEVDKVRDLAGSADVPPVRVFIGASYESQINDYFKQGNLQVQYTPMTLPQLSRETPQVPKVQIFRAGTLVKEWLGDVPPVDEVRQALETAPK
jgi:hypothetical protein